ncbi:hypothetical protein SSP24_76530 [Streptomyces spinoverrucosus]|uniref:Uncharacterized protein n=1 Tax=Streptomyces spinoverrucosus TaxID=284043 RepID=A0A4Y3VUS5_9ACTN|nr:hypothetical protein SSP24_76530 [Streptomyces spinoverrucosus]GHB51723.1 hypothetical protein GCM10010397_22540 [Streptomyces spinoverrucosus]
MYAEYGGRVRDARLFVAAEEFEIRRLRVCMGPPSGLAVGGASSFWSSSSAEDSEPAFKLIVTVCLCRTSIAMRNMMWRG